MKTKHFLLPVVSMLLLFLAACNNDYSHAPGAGYAPESAADSMTELSAEVPASGNNRLEEKALNLTDPSRKIIKTADLRCRVGDVYAATTRIERLANFTGGQIVASRMENVTDETQSLPYKRDSLRNVTAYSTTAHLTLRIPVTQLDTVLSDMAANAAFINSRNLHLDDVTLRYLSNKLKNDALADNDAARRARTLARRSADAVFSGDYTEERAEKHIDRRIENMQLTDQVTYATLTVDLYQPQRISHTIVPDIEYLMKPTIAQQAGIALRNGWELLRAIIIGLLQIWPLILLILTVLGFYGLRKRKNLIGNNPVRA